MFNKSIDSEEFNIAINNVLDGINSINIEESKDLNKRDKNSIKLFMEDTKSAMFLCNKASDNTNIKSDTILTACEPFFRYVAMSTYNKNLGILRRYGIGKKIAIAFLAGAAGAAIANNSSTWSGLYAGASVAAIGIRIATLPNDWQAIEPFINKVIKNAENAWLIAKINESSMN